MMRIGGPIAAAVGLWASAALATPPNMITAADYIEPTERYQHGVFGETREWAALRLRVDLCWGCAERALRTVILRLPDSHVFEDLAPRIVDLNDDARPEVVVVETDITRGARLAVYSDAGLMTATPYIGQTRRWLAPAGFADFDGDGQLDIAYVETPHLGRILRIFTLDGPKAAPYLRELGQVAGFTNHRFGDPNIWGGVRVCNGVAEAIGANPDWTRMLVARFDAGQIILRDAGGLREPAALDRALICD